MGGGPCAVISSAGKIRVRTDRCLSRIQKCCCRTTTVSIDVGRTYLYCARTLFSLLILSSAYRYTCNDMYYARAPVAIFSPTLVQKTDGGGSGRRRV